LTDGVIDHYGTDGFEDTRLRRTPHGRIEYVRTQELIRRHLPGAGSRILDVGGATGIHAAWLAADGHQVHVVDPVPTHVAAAAQLPGVTAAVGDARSLEAADASFDVVMLMGPLYHLTEPADRTRALTEASRVLRPGRLVGGGRHQPLPVFVGAGHQRPFDRRPGAVVADGSGHRFLRRPRRFLAVPLPHRHVAQRRDLDGGFPRARGLRRRGSGVAVP
jgi:SAM-dependent methyltransferase